MSKEYHISLELKLSNAILTNRILNELHHIPRAFVTIEDTDTSITTLLTCREFTTSVSRDSLLGNFTCTLFKARDWNPRTTEYLNLLNPDKRKRVRIYYGEVIGGTFRYVKVFTGVPTGKPETYSYRGSDDIILKGQSLGYLLHKDEGTYTTPTYTGTSKNLMGYFLDEAGLEYSLSYTDDIFVTQVGIAYNNALQGVVDILQAVGPTKEAFFDVDGKLIVRDIPTWSADDVEYVYTESNELSLGKEVDITRVVTAVDVSGDSDTAFATDVASAAMLAQYGRNHRAVSSSFVTSATQAEELAAAILEDGERFTDPYQFTATLNPYLNIGSFVTVRDLELSNISATQIRVDGVRHRYSAGNAVETSVEGYAQ